MSFRIEHIWAFVAVADDGDEGLVAAQVGPMWMPFVAADEGWPSIHVDLTCDTCGEQLAGELFRPAVVEHFATVAEFWLQVMQLHVRQHQRAEGAPTT